MGVPASLSGSRLSDRAQEVAAVPASIPNAACFCGKCLECDAAGYYLDKAIETFGWRIEVRRKAMRLTLEQLAARSGMSKSYIWEIENGKNKNPTIRTAFVLARALGWTLSECIGVWEHASLLHPEAMRIATEIDILLRPASAIEAGTAATPQSDAVHESAVPTADAQSGGPNA